MGLFKDFKEDLSQAVNEMMPGAEAQGQGRDGALVVDTLSEGVNVQSELSKLDGLLENVSTAPAAGGELPPIEPAKEREPQVQERPAQPQAERSIMSEIVRGNVSPAAGQVSDETTVITTSTVITGDLSTAGSFEIQGTINGNVTCNGKLSVTGTINGNSSASEFFADVAKIEGEVVSSGTVKIGAGSVIIGNISAASAVIAGAIKGDIDVQGPVVVDTSAVVMGNIKSRSVQINNGAVIEGFCSQCYADIDVQGLFDNK
ncbi:MAG: polymer-forming cytoskeletal protein [Agathobacter sp.]|nr:polymer-forming cytoskeletal protein [Agathobacter sp.]